VVCVLAVLVAIALPLGFAQSALAAETGAIAGTVTELAVPHDAIKGIEVCAFSTSVEESSPESYGCATTDSSGEYTISGLASGEYDVEFFVPFESKLNFVAQYYNGKASFKEAEAVSVVAGKTTSGIDAKLEEGGLISGKVTRASGGAAIQGIEVCASSVSPESYGCALTEASGEYTISGLASGDAYEVEFSSRTSVLDYITQYYNDKSSFKEADPVSVVAGKTTSGIDAKLEEGGRIAGRVTDASSGAALQDVFVCARPEIGGVPLGQCALTNSSGEYTISGLASGGYKVEFDAGKSYTIQYYDGKSSFKEAEAVLVTAPSTKSGVDAAMRLLSTAPVNTRAPVVSGTPAVGSTLLCAPGLWTGTPTPALTEQWLRDGAPIPGALASSYTVQSADAGHSLSCRVTAKNAGGEKSATSAAVAIPAIPAPAPVSSPMPMVTITGSKIVVSGSSVKGLRVKCSDAACWGSAELTVRVVVKRRKGKKTVSRKETLILAKGSFSLAAGDSSAVVLHLTAAGKKRLAHVKRHPLTAKLTLLVTAGNTTNKSVLVR
jgi:hypothetical protein